MSLCKSNFLSILIINKFGYYCNDVIIVCILFDAIQPRKSMLFLVKLCSCWLKYRNFFFCCFQCSKWTGSARIGEPVKKFSLFLTGSLNKKCIMLLNTNYFTWQTLFDIFGVICTVYQFAVLKISTIEHWPNGSLNGIQFGNEKAHHRYVI